MPSIEELTIERDFLKSALQELRKAYLAVTQGGAKSYTIDDRQITKFDLPVLSREIKDKQARLEAVEAQIRGCRPRRAFGIIPTDF